MVPLFSEKKEFIMILFLALILISLFSYPVLGTCTCSGVTVPSIPGEEGPTRGECRNEIPFCFVYADQDCTDMEESRVPGLYVSYEACDKSRQCRPNLNCPMDKPHNSDVCSLEASFQNNECKYSPGNKCMYDYKLCCGKLGPASIAQCYQKRWRAVAFAVECPNPCPASGETTEVLESSGSGAVGARSSRSVVTPPSSGDYGGPEIYCTSDSRLWRRCIRYIMAVTTLCGKKEDYGNICSKKVLEVCRHEYCTPCLGDEKLKPAENMGARKWY